MSLSSIVQPAEAALSAGTSSEPLAAVLRELSALGKSTNQAGQFTYTPAAPADWVNPDPTTIAAAIDRLAAAVAGLLSAPIP